MLVEVGVSDAVDVPGPVCELAAVERNIPLRIVVVPMVTNLLVAPAIVKIAMMVISIMVPIAIVVSIMAPIILIEGVTILPARLLPFAGGDPMFIGRPGMVLR
jgi:hypothetical protein